MGRKVIGRAFPISSKDAKSYDRVRPGRRRLRPNPIGVTTLAQINGRGAYSARAAAQGRSRAERLARARNLVKGGSSMQKNARKSRAKFVSLKQNQATKRRGGKRLAAYNAARKRGMSGKSAARSAVRRVPFTANERRAKKKFAGVTARMRRNRDSKAEQKRYEEGWEAIYGKGKKAEDKPKKRRTTKKGKTVAKQTTKKGARKGKGKRKGAKRRTARKQPAQYRNVKTTRRVKKTVRTAATRKQRVAYGQYRRARLFNPRTGRMEYSYYYRTKKGTYRRIPAWAVGGAKSQAAYKKAGFKAGGGPKTWARTAAARKRAADRILKEGGVFTPNKGKKKGKKRKGSKKRAAFWAAFRRARAAGHTKKQSFAIARGETSMAGKKRRTKGKSKRKARRTTKRRTTKRRTTKRRASKRKGKRLTKRQKAARKGARTRKRNAAAKKRTPRKRRKSAKRRGTARATTRRSTKRGGKRKGYRKNRRRSSKRRGSYRKNRRRSGYRRNQGFMKTLVMVLKAGGLALSGFVAHRVVTALGAEYGLLALIKPAEGEVATSMQLTLAKWAKPITGVGVAGIEILILNAVVKDEKTKTTIGAGIVASLLHSTVVTILMAAEQPKIAAQLEGYSNSLAYQLRGNRRRRMAAMRGMHGMRGLGAMRSIMPGYKQIGAAPFLQAAAGTGTGEYFQSNSVGEYFAPNGTQGVGAYEAAGPLAMQASAGVGQVIEDGIRPDDDLDRVLDLAESAAGLGEYYSAGRDNGGFAEQRVPTQSQWVPHGPLWAGTLAARGNTESSELPAGILAGPGGNGSLSGR
jgi:hypothetical protein